MKYSSSVDILFDHACAMVPHWYVAGGKEHERSTSIELERGDNPSVPAYLRFRTTRNFHNLPRGSYKLEDLEDGSLPHIIGEECQHYLHRDSLKQTPSRLKLELLSEQIVLRWLKSKKNGRSVDWSKLLNYAQSLRDRTYENDPVVFNALLAQATEDTHYKNSPNLDLSSSDEKVHKKIDPLASSLNTVFKLDKSDCDVLEYLEVPLADISNIPQIKYPSVFASIASKLPEEGDFSFHRTRRGDVLIIGREGLIASYRKGRWYLYDFHALSATFVDIFDVSGEEGRRFAGNILSIVLDISFQRHGALLVYDPHGNVANENLSNQNETLFSECNSGSPISIISERLGDFSFSSKNQIEDRRVFLEAASLDGAVLFNKESVLSCSSFISDAKDVRSEPGARSTAAKSALLHGGIPIKISADGDVTVYFHSENYFFPDNGDPNDIVQLHFA